MSPSSPSSPSSPWAGGGRPDGEPRWSRSLRYAGVLLPGPYLPHGEPVLWGDGGLQEVHLDPVSEHAVTDYVRKGGTPSTFRGSRQFALNFWNDWRTILPPSCPITSLEGCGFERIRTAAFRRADPRGRLQPATAEERARSAVAFLDGQPQPVYPIAVDAPGVFIGRSLFSSLTGRLRRRIVESDVELNVNQPCVDWVARWRDPLTGVVKYARLARASHSELVYARERDELSLRVEKALPRMLRRSIELTQSGDPASVELGVCLWFVTRFAMRVGSRSPKASALAGAYGVTTLTRRHVFVNDEGKIEVNFPGKEGLPYRRVLRNTPQAIHDAILSIISRHDAKPALFREATVGSLNREISSIVPRSTARVVRTAVANKMYTDTLRLTKAFSPVFSRKVANARVAILLNHRRLEDLLQVPNVPDLGDLDTRILRAIREGGVERDVSRIIREGRLLLSTSMQNYIRPSRRTT